MEEWLDLRIVHLIWQYGAWACFFVACGWAFLRGGPTERTAAGIIVASWGAWLLFNRLDGHGPGIVNVIIDAAGLVAFSWLALKSRRLYVFFLAACSLNTIATHLVAEVLHFGAYAYVTAVDMWGSYAPLIGLGFGVLGYRRRLRREAANR